MLPSGRFKIETSNSFNLDIYPIKVEHRNSIDNNLMYEVSLVKDQWAETPVFTENCNITILDKNQNILYKTEIDNFRDGDEVQNAFDMWVTLNPGAVGIAAGTNDGTGGEWVRYVKNNQLKAFLLEPSKFTFPILQQNYKSCMNSILMNVALNVEGGKVEFFTEKNGMGFSNSLIKKLAQTHYSEIESYQVTCVRIEDMLRLYNPKWIHLDIEGVDFQVILEILKFPELNPEVIIFEHIYLSESELDILNKEFTKNNYSIIRGQKHNSIALKNL
jgi:FkbM family methyltransferase